MSYLPPILVVEDSDDSVFLLNYAFQKVEILNPVQVVNCGEDAIAYLSGTGRYSDWKQFPLPSIVLLDLKLPGLDGLGVLRWIRQQPGLKALRVAMLTSSDLGQEINAAYQAGANVFLTKPIDLSKLVEMMRVVRAHWLEFAQAPQSWRPPHTVAAEAKAECSIHGDKSLSFGFTPLPALEARQSSLVAPSPPSPARPQPRPA